MYVLFYYIFRYLAFTIHSLFIQNRYIERKLEVFPLLWDCLLQPIICQFFQGSAQAEVHFASFLSGGFTTMVVINPPERKQAKPTSLHSAVQKTGVAVEASANVKKLSLLSKKTEKMATNCMLWFFFY